jgi:hypothetical protein
MSNLIDSLAQDRHAARYRSATHSSPAATAATAATATSDSLNAERSSPQSTRSRAGWLLIGLGLRLVMRGGDTPAHRARLIGQ